MKFSVNLMVVLVLHAASLLARAESRAAEGKNISFSSIWNFSQVLRDHGVKLPVFAKDVTKSLTVRMEPGPILQPQFQAVPVPESSALVIGAIGLLGLLRRRK